MADLWQSYLSLVRAQDALKSAQAALKAKADSVVAEVKATPANIQKEIAKGADAAADEVSHILGSRRAVGAKIPHAG